jgi:hypothetical protein
VVLTIYISETSISNPEILLISDSINDEVEKLQHVPVFP